MIIIEKKKEDQEEETILLMMNVKKKGEMIDHVPHLGIVLQLEFILI